MADTYRGNGTPSGGEGTATAIGRIVVGTVLLVVSFVLVGAMVAVAVASYDWVCGFLGC